MLILTRRCGESLMIGGENESIKGLVTVTVLGVKGNQVRVGVKADKSVPVHREEIFNRIQHEEHHEAPEAPEVHRTHEADESATSDLTPTLTQGT